MISKLALMDICIIAAQLISCVVLPYSFTFSSHLMDYRSYASTHRAVESNSLPSHSV